MLLAIDIGNSTVAFGLFEGDHLVSSFKAESSPSASAGGYLDSLRRHMAGAGIEPGKLTGIVMSSVVGPLSPVIGDAVKGISAALPLIVSPELKLPVKIKYDRPGTLGTDRLASACAAYVRYGGPVIVVDFGTATTLTVVDADGVLLGGSISPGLETGYEALIAAASGLSGIELSAPEAAIGKSIGEGLKSGIILGHAAIVEGLIERARAELGQTAAVVATGGLAGMVVPSMRLKVKIEPSLTLDGLQVIYKLNERFR